MEFTLFFAWQSDSPLDDNKHLIRDAARDAVKRISQSNDVEESPRLDHDTKGLSGTPEVANSILVKIEFATSGVPESPFVSWSSRGDSSTSLLWLIRFTASRAASRIRCLLSSSGLSLCQAKNRVNSIFQAPLDHSANHRISQLHQLWRFKGAYSSDLTTNSAAFFAASFCRAALSTPLLPSAQSQIALITIQ